MIIHIPVVRQNKWEKKGGKIRAIDKIVVCEDYLIIQVEPDRAYISPPAPGANASGETV